MHDYQVHVSRSVSGRERVGNDGTIPVPGRERVGNDGMVSNSGHERLGSRIGEFRLESVDFWPTMAVVFGVTSVEIVIDEGMQRDARNKESNKKAHRMPDKPHNRNSNHSLAAGHRWL